MKAAIEDPSLAVDEDSFVTLVRQANDVLDDALHIIVSTSAVNIQQLDNTPNENTRSASIELDYTGGDDIQILANISDRIKVLWLDDNRYYARMVEQITNNRRKIAYDDGDTYCLALQNEQWQLCTAACVDPMWRSSDMLVILESLSAQFGNKPFVKFHATAFPQIPMASAYSAEESEFKKKQASVSLSSICQLTQRSFCRMCSTRLT